MKQSYNVIFYQEFTAIVKRAPLEQNQYIAVRLAETFTPMLTVFKTNVRQAMYLILDVARKNIEDRKRHQTPYMGLAELRIEHCLQAFLQNYHSTGTEDDLNHVKIITCVLCALRSSREKRGRRIMQMVLSMIETLFPIRDEVRDDLLQKYFLELSASVELLPERKAPIPTKQPPQRPRPGISWSRWQ